MSVSPTLEGFRAAFRWPSIAMAEITWRWATGATGTALFLFGLSEYFSSLPVSNRELLFLRTRHPYLVGEALAHIFQGSMSRVVLSGIFAALLLALLWMITAALGRIATVRALLEHFQGYDSWSGGRPHPPSVDDNLTAGPLRSLIRLNFLRAVTALAAIFGFIGAAILASFASPDKNPHPMRAFLFFVPIAALVALAWYGLNWLLSLASMFAVRDRIDAMAALSAAVGFSRDRAGAVAAVSTWTLLAHITAFACAMTVISMPLGFATIVPWRPIALVMILATLAYFALADWLYTARLAGYVCIAEMPEALLKPPPRLPAPVFMPSSELSPSAIAPTLQTTMDRDEVILSDVPSPAPQTSIDHDEAILSDTPNLSS
jgi:hypothetical protein